MVSNPEGITENSPISSGPYVSEKTPSVRKSLRQFPQILDVKQKTAVGKLGSPK